LGFFIKKSIPAILLRLNGQENPYEGHGTGGRFMTDIKQYENDQWTLEIDELGFEKEAIELAKIILYCRPPFAVCVRGRWGSGKTSIMRYTMAFLGDKEDPIRMPFSSEVKYERNDPKLSEIQAHGSTEIGKAELVPLSTIYNVEDKSLPVSSPDLPLAHTGKDLSRINCVWFSPWRFQNDPNPMVPLLHTLRNHFSFWAKTRTSLGRIGHATVEAGLHLLGNLADSAAASFGFKTSAFSELTKDARRALERIDQEQLTNATDTERFNMLFEHAIGLILGVKVKEADTDIGDKNHRLVIFIDDLDRCEGDKAIKLLEAIKLYFSTKHCVFVFGLDQTALEQEIRNYWPNRPHGMACEYLEKLFQASIHVPVSLKYPNFICKNLVECKLLNKEESGEYSADKTSERLAEVLEPNPRKVKNFLNSLRAAAQASDGEFGQNNRYLFRFALTQRLKLSAPNTYNLLAQSTKDNEHIHLKKFFAACSGDSPDNPPFPSIGARDTTVFVSDFGHLVPALGKEEELGKAVIDDADLLVRLGRIRSDFELARAWLDELNDYNDFRKTIGLPTLPLNNESTPAAGSSIIHLGEPE
jgi:hypothetical protein